MAEHPDLADAPDSRGEQHAWDRPEKRIGSGLAADRAPELFGLSGPVATIDSGFGSAPATNEALAAPTGAAYPTPKLVDLETLTPTQRIKLGLEQRERVGRRPKR